MIVQLVIFQNKENLKMIYYYYYTFIQRIIHSLYFYNQTKTKSIN